MRFREIEFEYWTYPDGRDFKEIETFVENIDKEYFLKINKKRTDGLGGGLYELIIKITEDYSLLDLAKSYTEDGIKILIGFSIKTIFKHIKQLFIQNKSLDPEIREIILNFKDCKIRIYEVYKNGIEDNFDDIMEQLLIFRLENKNLLKKTKNIHIPILNNFDNYNLCSYRVKLNIDEIVFDYSKKDYLNFWGISTKKKKLIYEVPKKRIIKEKFYTQKAYDKLFDKAFKGGKLKMVKPK